MAQVKINDLSVGDWIKIQGEIKKIDYLYGNDNVCDVPIDFVEPIPITPEILEKNGFEVYDDAARLELDRPHSLWLFKEKEGWDLHLPSGEQHINLRMEYIHQLQHVLRFAGIEKEIEV